MKRTWEQQKQKLPLKCWCWHTFCMNEAKTWTLPFGLSWPRQWLQALQSDEVLNWTPKQNISTGGDHNEMIQWWIRGWWRHIERKHAMVTPIILYSPGKLSKQSWCSVLEIPVSLPLAPLQTAHFTQHILYQPYVALISYPCVFHSLWLVYLSCLLSFNSEFSLSIF